MEKEIVTSEERDCGLFRKDKKGLYILWWLEMIPPKCLLVIGRILTGKKRIISLRLVGIEQINKIAYLEYENGIGVIKGTAKHYLSIFSLPNTIFNYSLILSVRGKCNESSHCTGSMGILERGEADAFFGFGPTLFIGPLKFSPPLHDVYQEILTFPTSEDLTMREISHFTGLTWLLLILSTSIIVIIEYFKSKQALMDIIYYYLRFFLNQQSHIAKISLLHLSMSIFSFIVTSIFMSSLSSDLITIDDKNIINTFEQLENSKMIPFIYSHSTFVDTLNRSDTPFPKIRDRLNRYGAYLDFKDIFLQIGKSKEIAIISNNLLNTFFANFLINDKKTMYYKSKERILYRIEHFLLSAKLSPEKKYIFDFIASRIFESGIIWKYINQMGTLIGLSECNSCQIQSLDQLLERTKSLIKFENTRHLFLAPLVFFISAFFALIFECLHSKIIQLKK